MNPLLAVIAERQAVIARMGARAALLHFVERGDQERVVLEVLTEKDMAAWDRQWPAPGRPAP